MAFALATTTKMELVIQQMSVQPKEQQMLEVVLVATGYVVFVRG